MIFNLLIIHFIRKPLILLNIKQTKMNRDRDSDEESSIALYNQTPKVADVPDLVNLIADYCDDAALSKLSRVIIN